MLNKLIWIIKQQENLFQIAAILNLIWLVLKLLH